MNYKHCLTIVNNSSTTSDEVTDELPILNTYFCAEQQTRLTLDKNDFSNSRRVRSAIKKLEKKSLVVVIGGDGTINFVVSHIMQLNVQDSVVLLPLKGGNASDIASMLHGKYGTELATILANSTEKQAYAMRLTVNDQPRYVVAYVSVGALAFAMMRLDGLARDNKLLQKLRPLALISEAIQGLRALADASFIHTRYNGSEVAPYYDITYVNGSRIAKVYRTPSRLTRPSYTRFLVKRKHPLLFTHLLLLVKYHLRRYYPRTDDKYLFEEAVWLQIDGEVEKLHKGSTVHVYSEPKAYLVLTYDQ